MNFESIGPELREKALACKSPDELIALAKDEGYDLTDEQLEGLAGGSIWTCSDNECDNYDPMPW